MAFDHNTDYNVICTNCGKTRGNHVSETREGKEFTWCPWTPKTKQKYYTFAGVDMHIQEFVPFPKIARLNRDCTITEKLDGTNAGVHIFDRNDRAPDNMVTAVLGNMVIWASSRTRFIKPGNDNYAFADWVGKNAEALILLGVGSHFGEWWGQGIGRKYGLTERRFSLFNTERWDSPARPSICHVVPTLYKGPFDTNKVHSELHALKTGGSRAVPGWPAPEGLVVFHHALGLPLKVTCEKDEKPKGSKE